jgi:arsenite methyltransferase
VPAVVAGISGSRWRRLVDERPVRAAMQWPGCVAGALTEHELTDALTAAGMVDIQIRPTHVRAQAASAIVRARKPA